MKKRILGFKIFLTGFTIWTLNPSLLAWPGLGIIGWILMVVGLIMLWLDR